MKLRLVKLLRLLASYSAVAASAEIHYAKMFPWVTTVDLRVSLCFVRTVQKRTANMYVCKKQQHIISMNLLRHIYGFYVNQIAH